MSDTQTESARFAPPRARIDEPAATGPVLAGRWARLGAALIDTALALGILWAASSVLPWNPFDPTAQQDLPRQWLNLAAGFALFLLMHGYLLLRHGQTIGKRLLGLRIVQRNGQPATALRLVGIRYGSGFVATAIPMVGVVYALIDSLFIFNAQRRCLHDLLAGTIVVRT